MSCWPYCSWCSRGQGWHCKDTLGHVELLIKQHSQVLLLSVALNPFSIQSVFVLGTAPTQVQDLTFAFNKYSTAQGKKIRKEGNVSKINMDLIYQLPPQAKQTQPGESKFNLLPIKTNLEWWGTKAKASTPFP